MAAIEDFLADCERAHGQVDRDDPAEFNSVRTGRASTALLDRIMIDYYGTQTPLNNMATISAPEARLLTCSRTTRRRSRRSRRRSWSPTSA